MNELSKELMVGLVTLEDIFRDVNKDTITNYKKLHNTFVIVQKKLFFRGRIYFRIKY